MTDEQQCVASPALNHSLPGQQFSVGEPKIEGNDGPPLEDDTNGEAQDEIEEPPTGYLRGWRLRVLTAALDEPNAI